MGEETKKAGLAAICKAVEDANPGVKFDIQGIDYNQYAPLLKTKIAAGDAPDIIFGRPFSYPELVEAGHMMDLKGQPFLSRINQFALDGVTVGGIIAGLPIDMDIRSVYYNKDMFAKIGAEVPTTNKELIAVCEKFMAAGIQPFSLPLKKVNLPVDFMTTILFPMIYNSNPTLFTDIQAKKKTFADDPKFAQAVEIMNKSILNFVDPGDYGIEENQGNMNFASGKYPMIVNGMWALADFRKANPNGRFGTFAFPWSDNPADNKLLVGLDDIFMVSATTKNKDIVLKFLDLYCSPAGTKIWMDNAKMISVVKGVSPSNPDEMQVGMVDMINKGQIAPMTNIMALSGEYNQKYTEAFQVYAAGSKASRADVKAFVTKLMKDISNIQ